MRQAAALAALLFALAACGREEPPAPAGPAEAAPGSPSEPAPPKASETPAAPATAERLAFVDAGGTPRLLLDCLATPRPMLQATVAGFEKIGSEDRLTVGAGNEAFALVADLSAPGPGVVASGAIDRDLLRRIADGQPVRAVYGAQSVGPLQPADGIAPGGFVVRCRELAGS